MTLSWAYVLSLWVAGPLILIIFLLAIEAGLRSGLRIYRAGRDSGQAATDVTLTALLGLLGLLLAFTYGFSLNRYDERRAAMVDEVNAIGTAFLRADLLAEPGRTELRRRLLEYGKTRQVTAGMFRTREEKARTLARTLGTQAELWPATRAALTEDVEPPVAVAIVAAINSVLDLHTKRVVAGFDNIPAVVLLLLVLVSALSLGMIAHTAARRGYRSRWRAVAFALVLAVLIVIIMDFDMPLRGSIRVSQDNMNALIESMEAALN